MWAAAGLPGLRRRVHSRYVRRVAERPLVGRALVIRLSVRRFFCERESCCRRTFVEQVPDLSERYRRHSVGLRRWMQAVARFLGGRPGERLCRVLQLPTGRTHLLGLLTAPVVPERAPRVLGVDEFAFRKGWRYGTVLVDIEAARVVDVLPDRDAASFATWLREHPGAEIICRDRASAYSSAVREAVPEAQEVADRWHLLHNLSSAVEKTCHQHRSCLRKQAEADRDAEPRRLINPLPPPTLPPTKIAVRTVDRYSDIHRLLGQGYTVSEIARRLHLDRKTVRRFRVSTVRQFGSVGDLVTRPGSWAVQDALAEQVEFGAAEPHALEELDSADMAFDLAGAPWAAEGGGDGVEVSA